MLKVPYGVTTCLYNGIMDKIGWIESYIEFQNSHMKKNEPESYIERSYKEVVEAIEFYNEYCVVSGKYLSEALDKLTPIYKQYMKIN